MDRSSSGSPRRPFVRAEDRCIDCFRPSPDALCDACMARITATPVPGERLPWERGYDALLADLKDHAVYSDDAALALTTLYVEADDHTHPSHTAVVLASAMEHLTPLLTQTISMVLKNEGSPAALAYIVPEAVGRARLLKRLATLLLRSVIHASGKGRAK